MQALCLLRSVHDLLLFSLCKCRAEGAERSLALLWEHGQLTRPSQGRTAQGNLKLPVGSEQSLLFRQCAG